MEKLSLFFFSINLYIFFSFYLSYRGLTNLLFLWPILLGLHFSGDEKLEFYNWQSYGEMCIMALLSFTTSFLIAFGNVINFSFSLFLSLFSLETFFSPDYSNPPPPPQGQSVFTFENPHWRPNWGQPYGKNSGREILYGENPHRKNPYREKFEKFLQGQTVFLFDSMNSKYLISLLIILFLCQLKLIEL